MTISLPPLLTSTGPNRCQSERLLVYVLAWLLMLLVAACAAPVTSTTIGVAEKLEQTRLAQQFRGLGTRPTVRTFRGGRTILDDRVVEVVRDVIVHDYWVKGTDGRWYRIDEGTWRNVEVGAPLAVHR